MRTPVKLATTAAVLVGLSTVATGGGGTYAAFSASTENTGNSFDAGTVSLTDNDGGATAMFTATGMRPGGAAEVGCIRVTSTGTIAVPVRLHGTTTGTGLGTHLNLVVERGTQPATAFDACTGFTPDTANHKGLGNGVLYTGTLAAYPATHATGITDPNAAWTLNENHVYRFTVTLPVAADNAAQGKNATTAFTWEAQS